MNPLVQRRRQVLLLAASALLSACASTPPTAPPGVRQALAPTGTLRIAAYAGSPTSLVRAAGSADERGVTVEVGRELARRLGVPKGREAAAAYLHDFVADPALQALVQQAAQRAGLHSLATDRP